MLNATDAEFIRGWSSVTGLSQNKVANLFFIGARLAFGPHSPCKIMRDLHAELQAHADIATVRKVAEAKIRNLRAALKAPGKPAPTTAQTGKPKIRRVTSTGDKTGLQESDKNSP